MRLEHRLRLGMCRWTTAVIAQMHAATSSPRLPLRPSTGAGSRLVLAVAIAERELLRVQPVPASKSGIACEQQWLKNDWCVTSC